MGQYLLVTNKSIPIFVFLKKSKDANPNILLTESYILISKSWTNDELLQSITEKTFSL